MGRRFRNLKGAISRVIMEDDILGIKEQLAGRVISLQPAGGGFTYTWSSQKVDGFMAWLANAQEQEILEVMRVPGVIGPGGADVPWTNVYVQQAYQKGVGDTRMGIRREGGELPRYAPDTAADISAAFNQPFHADRAALLFTRTFDQLKGITAGMDQQISQVLTRGLSEGRGPREIARRINERVDAVGLTRAKLIARTEVINAHQNASMNEMELAEKIIGKKVLVQWFTAQDDRVRPRHMARETSDHGHGWPGVYTRDEARPLMGEPNCRCALLPFIPEHHEGERKPTATGKVAMPIEDANTRELEGLRTKAQLKKWAEDNLAERVEFTAGVRMAGTKDMLRTAYDINRRFDLDKLPYLGDPRKAVATGRRAGIRVSNKILGGYVHKTLTGEEIGLVFRNAATDAKQLLSDYKFSIGHNVSKKAKETTLRSLRASQKTNPEVTDELVDLVGSLKEEEFLWTTTKSPADVMSHEMGHRVFFKHAERDRLVSVVNKGWAGRWNKAVSRYADTSAGEYFAESFSLYYQGDHRRIFPELLELLKELDNAI
jgi:hypothetical protein